MKLAVWSATPSFTILKNAFQGASERSFRNKASNITFFSEIYISIKDILHFIIRAFYEVPVNIYYGMPFKARKLNKIIKERLNKNENEIDKINLFGIILEILKTKPLLHGELKSIDKILSPGNPVLLIANHPYVPLDGFTIMSVIHEYRSDYSFLINSNNFMHSLYPQFSHHFIPVKMTGGPLGTRDTLLAQRMSVRALKNCHECLESGKCLIIFPAGQGSKAKSWGEEIKDTAWLNGIGHIVKNFANNKKPLTILPIFIEGHMGGHKNSQRYLKAVIESPLKLGSSLQQALFNAPPTIDIHIGVAHFAEEYKGYRTNDITLELRKKVYSLAREIPIATRTKTY